MQLVTDSSTLRVNDFIIIHNCRTSRGHDMPIIGMMIEPPVSDGKLQFVETDYMMGVHKFRTLPLTEAGIVADESGKINSRLRTSTVADSRDLFDEFMSVLDIYTEHRDKVQSKR
ncbi:hypothetical protein FJZ39_01310 [Candidatus Saccharibacteria bacterium]|nr:hypothetical protein [Candidatus Saccharibacteria bacterium]